MLKLLSPSLSWLPTMLKAGTACQVCSQWQQLRVCLSCQEEFAPRLCRCSRCGLQLQANDTSKVCAACEDYPPDMDQVITAVDFAPPWSDVIGSLKFGATPAMAHTLSCLMADAVRRESRGTPDLIVPIPLSAQRWKERGYNQAWLLASQAARELGWTNRLHHHTLVRQRETGRLMAMQSDERQRSILHAFAIDPEQAYRVRGQHVAVVDDVMTTGATANEAARTLLQVGAASVTGWFAARTPAPKVKADQSKTRHQARSTRPVSDNPRPAKLGPKTHQ